MSNTKIIQKLQDAEAFFERLQEAQIKELLFTIQCSFDKEVRDLKTLDSWNERKILELINTKVHFNLALETIAEHIEDLKEEAKA